MANFSKKISIEVDLLTGKLKKGMTDFKTSVAAADGPVNKLKAGASSLGGTLKSLPFTAVAGGAALAGAAVAKFAVDSVNKYADMAIAADQVAVATGLSVDEASRWVSLAGDFGIEAGTLEASLGRLNREAGNNAEKFEEFGIEIAKTDTGATDVNGTFLNVLDTLQRTEDPAKRAAIAQELLGRQYQNLGPILDMTRGEIQSTLDATNEWEIVTEKNAEQAREWEAATDQLGDTIGSFSLKAGRALMPVMTDIVKGFTDVTSAASAAASAIGGLFDDLPDAGPSLMDKIGGVDKSLLDLIGVTGKAFDETMGLEGAMRAETFAMETARRESEHSAAAAADLAEETAELAAETEELTAAFEANLDATDDLADAQNTYLNTLDGLATKLDEARNSSTDAEVAQSNYNRVLRDARQDAEGAAEQAVALAESAREAEGATLTAAEKQVLWNESMLTALDDRFPELNAEILDWIGRVNDIPTSTMTDIEAAVAAGDLAEAERLLNEAARERGVDLVAAADTIAAERALNEVAREREARVRVVPRGSVSFFASGGTSPGGPAVVGEQGPELVDLPAGARVSNASDTRRRLAQHRAGDNYVTINVARPVSAAEIVKLQRQYERRNGSITLS